MRMLAASAVVSCLALSAGSAFADGLTRVGAAPISSNPADPHAPAGRPHHEPGAVAATSAGGHVRAWVLDIGTPGIAVFDLASSPAAEEAFLAAPAGFGRPVALDAKAGVVAAVYFDPSAGSHVAMYDAAALGAPIAAFAVGGAPKESQPGGIALGGDGSFVLVTDRTRNTVRGYFAGGPQSGQPTGPERATTGVGAASVRLFHFGTNERADIATVVLTESGAFDVLRVVDHAVLPPVRTVAVGLKPERIFVQPSGSQILVPTPGDDSLWGEGGQVGRAYELTEDLDGPLDVAALIDDTRTQHLFVVSRNRPKLSRFAGDPRSVPAFVESVALRGAPAGVAAIADPSGDGIRVIVSSAASDGIEDFVLR
jgi:hypothetical protein